MRSLVSIVALATLLIGGVVSAAQSAQPSPTPRPQQEEFVPIDQLPPEAELPAAPMVVAAYAFIWVAFLVYVISLVKRIRRVENDLQRLEREPRR
jgi:CcmD family protein